MELTSINKKGGILNNITYILPLPILIVNITYNLSIISFIYKCFY